MQDLPEALDHASQQDVSAAAQLLAVSQRLCIVCDGPGLAVAKEASLRFQQTCGIATEAFTLAEMAPAKNILIDAAHPLLVLAPRGPSQSGLIEWASEMRMCGARVLLAAPSDVTNRTVTLVQAPHRDLDPITAFQSLDALIQTVRVNVNYLDRLPIDVAPLI